ncbi:unnamed protein product, partial [Staurois parvus]
TLLTASAFLTSPVYVFEYCCLHRHPAPCATFGSPHTAARSILIHGPLPLYGLQFKLLTASPLCHGPLYRLLLLLPGPECVMGPCTASHCC